jgi:PIN domain nuclease of toxin-antitoxin system
LHVGGLAWHHRDPFDRLLIAQAAAEPMRLLTADEQLLAYGGPVELV